MDTEERADRQIAYVVVIVNAGSNYSAYVPDLPGCIAAGGTIAEVTELIRGAIEMHLEGMCEDGVSIPLPSTIAGTVTVSV